MFQGIKLKTLLSTPEECHSLLIGLGMAKFILEVLL
jgi:hypothetical protein